VAQSLKTGRTDFATDGFNDGHPVAPFRINPGAFPLVELDKSDALLTNVLGDSHRVYQAITLADNPGYAEFSLFARVAENQAEVSAFFHTHLPEHIPYYVIFNHKLILFPVGCRSFNCYFLLTLAIYRLLSIKSKHEYRLAKISKI